MAGRVQWEAQVDSNVAKLLSETKELRDQLDGIKKGNYEIKLNIDDKKLEKVISNLDKMLESLGKGTDDFKEFENLSKQLNEIVLEVKELNKAFGGINDSGVSNLLSSIQSIDKSLSSLSEHITNVNKDFGSVGKNASDNVGQINEARKATEGLTEATRELANAQKNVGNKSNISSGNTVSSSEVKNNEEVANAIRKKKEELASYELQVEELRYEIEKLSKTENESYGFKKAFPSLSDKQIDSFKERIYNSIFGTDKSRGYGLQKYLNMGKIDDESVIKSYRAWSEELDKVGYKLSELRQTSVGVEADIIPINGKAVTNAEEFRKVLFSISNAVSDVSSEKVVELSNQILELETKISSIKAEIKSLSSTSSTPIKDTFQGDKIQETVNSARELDRTLEQVDIPKENFDEVINKLKLAEIKAKDIVKITKQMRIGEDGKPIESYTLKDKYGSTEIYGVSSNKEKGQLLSANYVQYDAKQARDEAKALERAAKQAQKLAEEKRKARQADKQATQSSVDKALKDQLDAWEAIQKIRLQIAQTDSKDTDKLHNLNEQKKSLQKQYNEAGKVLKANKDLYNQTEQQLKLDHERLETNEKINKLKLTNDVGSVLSKGDSDLKKFEARKNQSEEYRATVEKLKQSIEELRVLENSRVSSKLLSAEEVENINKAIASVKEYTEMIKNMPAVEKGSDEGSRTKLANRIHEYMDKNTRMTREFREEFENLIRVLRSGDDSVNIKDIARQFEDVKFRVKEAKLEGISFFDIFKNKAIYGFAARLAQYYLSFYDFIRYARYAVNTVVELNTQMINLSKVSEQSVSQISDDFSSYAKTAKEVGATISDTISATTNWAKNGYNIPDSQELAEVALIYKNVGDIDIESANESLISTIRGFKLEAEDAMRVIDVFNEVSNNEAISAGGIGEALKRSAASFSAANTSLEQSVALITATRLQNWLNAWKHVLRIYLIAIEVFITMHHNIEETTI